MRRFPLLRALLTAAILVSPLAGCSGGGGDGRLELVIWEQRDPQERAVMEAVLAEYAAANPQFKFSVVHYDTENLRNQFQTAAWSGGGADLVYGPSDQIGPFSEFRIIKPLDSFLPPDFWDRFLPGALDTLDGHVWALPDQVGNHLCLLVNTELVPVAPETYADLVAIGLSNTNTQGKVEERRYGLAYEFNEPFWFVPFLTACGGWVMDEDRRPTLDTPACVRALGLVKDLRDLHRIVPRECNYQLMDTLFKERKAAMIINGPWSFEDYRKAGVPFAIARIPKADADGPWAAPMIGAKGYSVNAGLDPAKTEAVTALLDHLTSAQVTARFAKALGVLPSVQGAYADSAVAANRMLVESLEQWKVGRRMPVVVEMRAVWDAMRPNMQSVLNGSKSPEEGARDMQEQALRNIETMLQ